MQKETIVPATRVVFIPRPDVVLLHEEDGTL